MLVHTEAQTFDRRAAAVAWLKRREADLAEPGALERLKEADRDVTLREAIIKYEEDDVKGMGRTKGYCLAMTKKHPLAEMKCGEINSTHVVAFAKDLNDGWMPPDSELPKGEKWTRQAQTVGNYLSHLATIFTIAKPMWGIKLDPQAIKDAQVVLKRTGQIRRSRERDRRPTLEELDKVLDHFDEQRKTNPRCIPMSRVTLFALFSTRRQEEITRLRWDDYQPEHKRILVRDMKHPGQKIGNDVWVELTPEAMAVIDLMPKKKEEIFPFNSNTISSNFTRSCALLGIDDLHFHDLRHEGISRLFEMARTIPQVAVVSGHRSWSSLKRYSHIMQTGDKYENWPRRPKRMSEVLKVVAGTAKGLAS